ncbi:MAG: TetR/AcrR family transcriptional regulator [Pontibacterium sp.]
MTRGRQPEHSREKILNKGLELFARQGYNATGLKEILDTCEVSKGSFYNFFGNKEQFAIEIIEHYKSIEFARWDEQMEALQGSHLSKIAWMLNDAVKKYEQDSNCVGCLLTNLTGEVSQASPLFSNTIRASANEVLDAIENDMVLCQQEGSVRTDLTARQLAEIIWSGWQGALLRVKVESTITPLKNHIETILTLIKTTTPQG